MRPTEPFRKEHEELLAHIDHIGLAARELPGLDPAERREVIDRVLGFLSGTLLPHAKAEEDVLKSYNLHANCYVTKPVDLEQFIVVVKSIDMFWLTVVTLPNGKEG